MCENASGSLALLVFHTHTHFWRMRLSSVFLFSPKVKLAVIEVDGKTTHKLGDLVNAVCPGSHATVTVFRRICISHFSAGLENHPHCAHRCRLQMSAASLWSYRDKTLGFVNHLWMHCCWLRAARMICTCVICSQMHRPITAVDGSSDLNQS